MTDSKRDKIRGVLLAALMVVSVFAAAAPATAAVASADRTVASSTVSTGGTTTVTVTATMDGNGGRFALSEQFSGEVASASVQSVTVDGNDVTSQAAPTATANGVVVRLSSTGANAQVQVTYEITATQNSGQITIDGSVAGGGTTIDLGTDTITVGSSTNSAITSASRSVGSSTITTGSSASVTVSATLNSSGGDFALSESFSGPVASASIQSVTVNGNDVTNQAAPTITPNGAVVRLQNLPGGATVEVNYQLTAGQTTGQISISGNVASSGTVSLGTDTITVQSSQGPQVPSGLTDNTAQTNTARNVDTEIGDLSFSTSGTVDSVTLDPAGGSAASGVEADDIDSLAVTLLSGGSSVASASAQYNGNPVTLNVGSVSGVDRVRVVMDTSGNIEDGDVIDLGIALQTGNSRFPGSGLYDTVNTTTALVGQRQSFISAEVRDRAGTPITQGSVTFENVNTGRDIATVPLNQRGETQRVKVAPGRYEALVQAPGFETFSARVRVAVGETREIDVTLESIEVLERIEVQPQSATGIANQETLTYTVTAFNKSGGVMSGVTIQASDNNQDIVFTSPTSNTTDANGEATFSVTSPVIATGTLTFEAINGSGGDNPTATATATFIRSGQGAIDGQVLNTDTTSGLPGATVYAVLESRWHQNTYSNSVDLTDFNLADDDDTVFVRLVDADTGQIIDNDDYDIRTRDNSETGVRKVEELNTTDDAVGEGFALVDVDDDGLLTFNHTRLADEDYYAQVSLDATNAGDDRLTDDDGGAEAFVNVSGADSAGRITDLGGPAAVFDPTADLTVSATRQRAQLSGANLVDTTDSDGDFKLTKLYTEFQQGRTYVVVAEKAGFSRDFADVFVQEDGAVFEDRTLRGFNLSPEDVEPAAVNITQIGLHPPLSQTGGVPNASKIRPFSDQSDAFVQEVPRDGSTIDVVLVETLDEDGNRLNGTAEVAVEDNVAFDGSWDATTYGGTTVSVDASQDQITVNTGSDGVATLLLFADSSPNDLLTNKTAVLTNDRSATDETTVRFIGQVEFRGAAISGIVTDTNDDPVQDSVAYVESFIFPTDQSVPGQTITRTDQTRFTIRPTGGIAANAVDEASDTFTVTRQRWDGTAWVDVASATVTRSELANYRFPNSDFPGVTINISSSNGFKLVDIVELTGGGQGQDPDASYTLDPVPAVPGEANVATTEYNVRGIKLTDPNASATRFGQAAVQPGSTDDANIVLPIDVTAANLQVTNLTAPSSAQVGDTITVSADITNTGGALGQVQQVDFRVDLDGDGTLQSDETLLNQTVDIDPQDTQRVTFNVPTGSLSAGTYLHGVASNDDVATAQITLTSGQPNFQVVSVSAPANITQGDTLNVSATINNTGTGAGTTPVQLNINGTNVSTGTGAVDVAFMIDTSTSMSQEINGIRNGLTDFTNTLQSQGIDVRYAVVTFADQQPYNLRQRYTSDVSQTQQTLNNIPLTGATEQSFATIQGSIGDLNARPGAQEIFVVFTDESSNAPSGVSQPSASSLAQQLDSEGITLFGVTYPESDFRIDDPALSVGRVANLSANGQFFNLAGNFSAKFENQIAGAIANIGAGQQISLNASESGTVTFSIPGNTTANLATGNYTIEVSTDDDTGTAPLRVGTGCTNLNSFVAQYDADGNCDISITEVGQASSDFATGQITITEFGQVSAAYART